MYKNHNLSWGGFIPGIQGRSNSRKFTDIIYHIYKLKEENDMITSKDSEKCFGKIQNIFIIQI